MPTFYEKLDTFRREIVAECCANWKQEDPDPDEVGDWGRAKVRGVIAPGAPRDRLAPGHDHRGGVRRTNSEDRCDYPIT
jgi:hypothetical protein